MHFQVFLSYNLHHVCSIFSNFTILLFGTALYFLYTDSNWLTKVWFQVLKSYFSFNMKTVFKLIFLNIILWTNNISSTTDKGPNIWWILFFLIYVLCADANFEHTIAPPINIHKLFLVISFILHVLTFEEIFYFVVFRSQLNLPL